MNKIKINRAPVLTLWATVVAERLGYKHAEALTLAKALTGTTAQAHAQKLGIHAPSEKKAEKKKAKESKPVKIISQQFLAKKIGVVKTKEGVRAVSNGQPIKPESVERYLISKFGDALPEARDAMQKLARSLPPKDLAANAYKLYGKFTPQVPSGAKGWGAKGELDLDVIRALVDK
ncbi:MAG: hypothetical protein HZB51_18430 [Chloroflexi bacterium]|nr:hypothetical protein [Chloroflexota bacterium]